MVEEFFPFKIGMPANLRKVFLQHNRGLWFEVDVTIHSTTRATFHVYGMFDSVWGGRGERLRDMEVSEGLYGLLVPHIQERALRLAERQHDLEIEHKRQAKITLLAADLLAKHGGAE
ncbi:hypothetical protein [Rhizobium leucaenae]|uniref:hypothetical protein n=1 Tax=Rhizobium leucaenae TaxID=29450 RepID=UPI000405DF92|nr:hypothetical protein [Rhizobium leucaenae]